jgi:hypothetical protein
MPPANQTAAHIFLRDIGFSSTSNLTCARPLPDEHGEPLFGSVTFHTLMIYVSAACLGITTISCIFLSWRHLHRYTSSQEQRQILRIINLPFMYCLFNFLSILFVMDYQYIEPIAGIYEAFTTAALFMLTLEWVCPDGIDRERYFNNLEMRDKKGNPVPGGSLKWFQVSSLFEIPIPRIYTEESLIT